MRGIVSIAILLILSGAAVASEGDLRPGTMLYGFAAGTSGATGIIHPQIVLKNGRICDLTDSICVRAAEKQFGPRVKGMIDQEIEKVSDWLGNM